MFSFRAGSPLFLPDTTVFPGLITSVQHVVYFNFGYLTADEFHGVEPSPQVTVNIPLLSDHPSGPPSYSLAVAKFYTPDRGDIPAVNVAYPYYPVDEIRINDDGAVIQHGQEELRVSFVKSKPCKPPNDIVQHEFTEFVLDDFQTGAPLPDFSYCQRHPEETSAEFCQVGEQLEDDLQSWKYQICQAWESHDHTSCETSIQIEKITPFFRDILALGDNQPIVVASESYHGHYTVKMRYPC